MGKASLVKGNSWSCKVAKDFRIWWSESKRKLQFQQGHGVPDVIAGPFGIECKAYKKPLATGLYAALEQCINDIGDSGLMPIVVAKFDYKPPVVVIKYKDFKKMIAIMFSKTHQVEQIKQMFKQVQTKTDSLDPKTEPGV